VGVSVFGDFSFGNIFQQVSLRLVTHCAGGFVGGYLGGCGNWGLGGDIVNITALIIQNFY
jgi:hypothetical protein